MRACMSYIIMLYMANRRMVEADLAVVVSSEQEYADGETEETDDYLTTIPCSSLVGHVRI